MYLDNLQLSECERMKVITSDINFIHILCQGIVFSLSTVHFSSHHGQTVLISLKNNDIPFLASKTFLFFYLIIYLIINTNIFKTSFISFLKNYSIEIYAILIGVTTGRQKVTVCFVYNLSPVGKFTKILM